MHVQDACDKQAWVTSHVRMSHVTLRHVARLTCGQRGTLHIYARVISRMTVTCDMSQGHVM